MYCWSTLGIPALLSSSPCIAYRRSDLRKTLATCDWDVNAAAEVAVDNYRSASTPRAADAAGDRSTTTSSGGVAEGEALGLLHEVLQEEVYVRG